MPGKIDMLKTRQMLFWSLFGMLAVLMLLIPDFVTNSGKNADLVMRMSLRNFHSAQIVFRSSQKPPAYAAGLDELIHTKQGIKLLDETWLETAKDGFLIHYQAYLPDRYYLLAERQASPFTPEKKIAFCVDQTGIILGTSKEGSKPVGGTEGCSGGIPVV